MILTLVLILIAQNIANPIPDGGENKLAPNKTTGLFNSRDMSKEEFWDGRVRQYDHYYYSEYLSPNKTIRILPKTDEYPMFDFNAYEFRHKLSNKTIIIINEPGGEATSATRSEERGETTSKATSEARSEAKEYECNEERNEEQDDECNDGDDKDANKFNAAETEGDLEVQDPIQDKGGEKINIVPGANKVESKHEKILQALTIMGLCFMFLVALHLTLYILSYIKQ